jgi:hypothetical protein
LWHLNMAPKRLHGAALKSHLAKKQKLSESTQGSSSQVLAEAPTSLKGKGREKAKEEPEAEPTLLLADLSKDAIFPPLPEVSDDDIAAAVSYVSEYKSSKKNDKTEDILSAFLKFLPDDGKRFFVHDVLAKQNFKELAEFALELRNLLAKPREH